MAEEINDSKQHATSGNGSGNGTGATRTTLAEIVSGQKTLTPEALSEAIQTLVTTDRPPASLVFYAARKADEIPPWGERIRLRDRYLREFWPTEPVVSGVVATVATQYSARQWKLKGPARMVKITGDLLESADLGGGMVNLFLKTIIDLKTQDNGAFWGLPRADYMDAETALERIGDSRPIPPVTSIEHLDAGACMRTGNPLYPVIYTDPDGGEPVRLPWHMVVPMAELPSPQKLHRGIQLSALSRLLRAAQIMRSYQIYKDEKIGGRGGERIHIIGGGVNRTDLEDALGYNKEDADRKQLLRWEDDIVLTSIAPDKAISTATLERKSAGAFDDLNAELTWYLTLAALDFLESYQVFAPLQSGNLGNSQQSIMLEEIGRGKGPALFQKMIQQIMYQYAIIPRSCEWEWGDRDNRAEQDRWTLINLQIDAINKAIDKGWLPVPLAQQIAADNNVLLNDEYLALIGKQDQTGEVTVMDDEPEPDVTDVTPAQVQQATGTNPTTQAGTSAAPAVNIGAVLSKAEKQLKKVFGVDRIAGKHPIIARGSKASAEAEAAIAEFANEISEATTGYIEGVYRKSTAKAAFIRAITNAYPQVGEIAYNDGGSDFAEIDEEDAARIDAAVMDQVSYAEGFWDALPDIKEAGTEVDSRVDLYVRSLAGFYGEMKAIGAGNPMLTFNLGPTEMHCQDKGDMYGCADLAGKRYSFKKWERMGVTPGKPGSNTTCGGFKCECYFTDDNGDRWG